MTTKFETKNLDEATPEQLRYFASAFLGIPTEGLSDADVRARIMTAHEGETIYVRVGEDDHVQAGSPPPDVEKREDRTGIVGSLGHDDPKVKVTLHAEERDGVVNNRHKEVGVNGVVWLLKRGESITIPYRVFEALKNAERHVITHDSEGNVREQVVKSTPYNVDQMPSEAEIAAWHARVDDQFVP